MMKKDLLRYLKHVFFTFVILLAIGLMVLVSLNGSIGYYTNPLSHDLDQEGPYVFYQPDSMIEVTYIQGNKDDGFSIDKSTHKLSVEAQCFFRLDSSSFTLPIINRFTPPPSIYEDQQPILAISDIESGYKTFRDFLITHQVINQDLQWTFGRGHLVLLGDFMDRGFSTTQVLWFIYKLENEAEIHGGHVHFILGNHELYNLQGNFKSASYKYYAVSAILGKLPHQLYDHQSFIGRWLASKNTVERINGNLFVHGGLHHDFNRHQITIQQINDINRDNYHKPYYPKPENSVTQLITSTKKGLCWYRGYFKDDLPQASIDSLLQNFKAKSIVVGHTLQWNVQNYYQGKIVAIDVKHPKDYEKNWPAKNSEGILIKEDKYYRLKADGSQQLLY